MPSRRQRARLAAERAIAAGQLQLPLDLDQLAIVVGAKVEVDPDLPHLPAYRDGDYVVMQAGLSRSKQRMYGGHEIGHVALDSVDVEMLSHGHGCVQSEEEEVNEFRNRVLVPPLELFSRIENGETEEELCWAYGLEREDLHKIYQSHLKTLRRKGM